MNFVILAPIYIFVWTRDTENKQTSDNIPYDYRKTIKDLQKDLYSQSQSSLILRWAHGLATGYEWKRKSLSNFYTFAGLNEQEQSAAGGMIRWCRLYWKLVAGIYSDFRLVTLSCYSFFEPLWSTNGKHCTQRVRQ